MKVLQVFDITIPMLAGYTSRSKYIVNTQKSLGIQPVIVSSPRHESPGNPEEECFDDIQYYRTRLSNEGGTDNFINKLPFTSENAEIQALRRRIVEVARREQPDLIHAHSSILCGIPAFLASRQLGIPCVYEIRAFWEDAAVDRGTNTEQSAKYRAIQTLETRLAHSADAVIGICEGIREELELRGVSKDHIYVVPNGVVTEKFQPMDRDQAIVDKFGFQGKTVVGYIGTFAKFEGVPYLVKALIQLIKSGRDDLRGIIVGSGRTYAECEQLAKDAGLDDKIIHPGRVSHDEVRPLYSVVDIFAYPRESARITELVTPLKPLEAMSMKKSVIGSNVGGLKELITDGETGLIHRHDDVNDLAAKIEMLADDSELRAKFGENGRQFVEEKREWRGIIETHFDVYKAARMNWRKRQYTWKGLADLASFLGKGM
ncbi:MAG: glycosyltransferase [Myxococcota bacterium]|nr:glycosyltransferase [Myxococcota bacterium]